MALELHDTANFDGTIADTESEELVVDTSTAEYIKLLLDDTNGGDPSSYDVDVEFYSTAVDAYLPVESQSDLTETNPDIVSEARGQSVRVTITGSGADYRISLESFKEI